MRDLKLKEPTESRFEIFLELLHQHLLDGRQGRKSKRQMRWFLFHRPWRWLKFHWERAGRLSATVALINHVKRLPVSEQITAMHGMMADVGWTVEAVKSRFRTI